MTWKKVQNCVGSSLRSLCSDTVDQNDFGKQKDVDHGGGGLPGYLLFCPCYTLYFVKIKIIYVLFIQHLVTVPVRCQVIEARGNKTPSLKEPLAE